MDLGLADRWPWGEYMNVRCLESLAPCGHIGCGRIASLMQCSVDRSSAAINGDFNLTNQTYSIPLSEVNMDGPHVLLGEDPTMPMPSPRPFCSSIIPRISLGPVRHPMGLFGRSNLKLVSRLCIEVTSAWTLLHSVKSMYASIVQLNVAFSTNTVMF